MGNSLLRGNRGFTLLEVIIAMSIMFVAFAAIFTCTFKPAEQAGVAVMRNLFVRFFAA